MFEVVNQKGSNIVYLVSLIQAEVSKKLQLGFKLHGDLIIMLVDEHTEEFFVAQALYKEQQ